MVARRSSLGVLAAVLLAAAPATADDVDVRLDVGVIASGAKDLPVVGVDLLVGGRADVLLTGPEAPTAIRLSVQGRTRLDLRHRARPEATRFTRLGLRFEGARVVVGVGRQTLPGGGFRVVDGVAVLAEARPGVRVGGWLGLLPDAWTTAPSVDRIGGGPMIVLGVPRFRLTFVGEIAAALAGPRGPAEPGPAALDRVALRTTVDGRPIPALHLAGHLDLQGLGEPARVAVAAAGAGGRWRVAPSWTLRARWDAFSSLAHLVSEERNQSLRRHAERAAGIGGLDVPLGDLLDDTVWHVVSAGVERAPRAGEGGDRFTGAAQVRYRHHPDPDRRHVRAGGRAGLVELVGGALGLEGTAALLWTGGRPRLEGGARVDLLLPPDDRVMLDLAVVATADLSGDDEPQHVAWMELFLAARIGRGFLLAAGYQAQAAEDWTFRERRVDLGHGGFVRGRIRF